MERPKWFLYILLLLGVLRCDQKDPASTDQGLVIARVSGNGQEGQSDKALLAPLVVLVTNRQGVPIANQRVDFEVIEGKGQLSVESTVTSAEGQASTRLRLGGEEGVVKVRATVFGSGNTVEFTETALATPPLVTGDDEPTVPNTVNVLHVDGSGDWVRVPVLTRDNPLSYPGSGGWSIELWLRPSALSSIVVAAGQASIDQAGRDPYYLHVGDGSSGEQGGGGFDIGANDGNGTSATYAKSFLRVGTWTHIAGTFAGGGSGSEQNTLRFYVNGEQVAERLTPLAIGGRASTNDPFAIGALASFYGEEGFVPFAGDIDEVRVWNRTLTQEEIQANMHSALTGSESGLVGYWSFNELTTDGKVPDLTGNANQGVLLFDAHLAYSADAPVP